MFLHNRFYLLDVWVLLLKDLVGDDPREHMAGDSLRVATRLQPAKYRDERITVCSSISEEKRKEKGSDNGKGLRKHDSKAKGLSVAKVTAT